MRLLTERLHDPRHPSDPLSAGLLKTRLARPVPSLRQDPSLRVAATRRGAAALEEGTGLASQPTCRWTRQPAGEPSGPAPGGDGAGVPSEMIEGRRRNGGKKTPRKKRRKKTMYLDVYGLHRGPWASPGKRTDTIASGCTTGWWRVVPRGPDRRGDFSGSHTGEEGAG